MNGIMELQDLEYWTANNKETMKFLYKAKLAMASWC